MIKRRVISWIFLLSVICSFGANAQRSQPRQQPVILKALMQQPDLRQWPKKDSVKLQFKSFHTQGLTKVGDYFYLTAVEVKQWPRPYNSKQDGFDRDTGDGIGHLFKFDGQGHLIQQITLGEGSVYHPGGIDFDGTYIWVPVCEYRPNGASFIYRVNPATLVAEKMAALPDAIGAVAYNRDNNQLIGMNWDAREFYIWQYQKQSGKLQQLGSETNHHHFIRYQDCNYIGNGMMLCSGLRGYGSGPVFRLGGLQAIRLNDYSAVADMPVPVWKSKEVPLTNNPFFCESKAGAVTLYFVPEDDDSLLYSYEVLMQ